jgi:hypothetical protein
MSTIQGNVTVDVDVTAYGLVVFHETINPCTSSTFGSGLCPMNAGQIDMTSNIVLDQSTVDEIPSITYTVPDLEATVRVMINGTSDPDVSLACVEANLSNGKTVYQKGVGWSTAVTAGLSVVASAISSGLGHSNTAAHVAANALSLFGYFQDQAIVGLTAVLLPPIVQSWTQNFQWCMGIIEVGFMQTIATWYQKSTGGTPATILNTLTTASVSVQKRSLSSAALRVARRAAESYVRLFKRVDTNSSGNYVVKGITRVAFRAGIESTNLFMTGLMFFCIFMIFTMLSVATVRGVCGMLVKANKMSNERFQEFRNGWATILKGIMFRIFLIGCPQMTILCLWELTQHDSPAEIVLAVFFFVGMTGTLAWAAVKVILIARCSVTMHKSPAYILYADPSALNRWGFLYVQFRASAYYFILPILVYILIKAMFIAIGQNSGTTQAVALLIIEAIALIGASVLRPWMDKPTNAFNISIRAMNFLNAIFLVIFTNIFDLPGLVTGIVGIVFFVANAVLSLILLVLLLVAMVYAFVRKNPDARYQPIADDRASFIKSQTALLTELDALGATARGDTKDGHKNSLEFDKENGSRSSDSNRNPESRSSGDLPLIDGAEPSSQSPYGLPNSSTLNLAEHRMQNTGPAGFRLQNNAR